MKKKTLTPKQLQRQLDTWQRKMPSKAQDIMTLAQEKGILTSKGAIRKPRGKEQTKRFQEFEKEYRHYYKSYSKWEKKQRSKYKIAKENDYTQARSWKEYYGQRKEYSDLLDEAFANFTSAPMYEEKTYLDTLPIEEAIERLREEVKNKELKPIEQYKMKYGTFDPSAIWGNNT